MKRRELIRDLVAHGCYLYRHGHRHDVYLNPKNGKKAPIPRHAEIKNSLAELVKRQLGIAELRGPA